MKLSLNTLACFVIVYAAAVPSHAQCTVASNSGYSVHLNVYPEAIVPATMSCPYGYNYQVRMRYDITFSGSNIPSELYTLQGRVHCGSTNLFFDLGSGLSTPPLSSGCLPGCLRAELIETGQVRVAILPVRDLPIATLFVGNSLRGLVAARR